MQIPPASITAIFRRHEVAGPWSALPSTGVANHVYATRDVVLRIATDHLEAVPDARTESVAAPVAHAAGIRTPRLIAFDDSRSLIDRPFSLWQRIHGLTLGLSSLAQPQFERVWYETGRELARLHQRVTECHDPLGHLDQPERDLEFEPLLARARAGGFIGSAAAREIESLLRELESDVRTPVPDRFLHNDVHAMNVLCSDAGELFALIDWGDAGWGDPLLDFAAIPLDAIPHALRGYATEDRTVLDPSARARLVWDKLLRSIDHVVAGKTASIELDRLVHLLDRR